MLEKQSFGGSIEIEMEPNSHFLVQHFAPK